MMPLKTTTIPIISLLALLSGCNFMAGSSSIPAVNVTQSNATSTSLSQEADRPTPLTLSLSGFDLTVPAAMNAEVAIQVCASTKVWPKVTGDAPLEQLPCFEPGTGMAMHNTPAGLPMYVSEGDGHNYYSVERRVSSANETTVHINRVTPANVGEHTYLAVLIDANQDGVANQQERWYATATWE